jgi:glucose/arabinose dehydrogenase
MKSKFFSVISVVLLLSACTAQPAANILIVSPPDPTSLAASSIPTASPIPSATPTPVPTAAPTVTASPSPVAIATVVQSVVSPDHPLTLPAGFGIGVFARGLRDPRMMAIGPDGLLYVAERGAGRVVRLPDANLDGQADQVDVIADGINQPNSLAFGPDGSLYVSETTRVWHFTNPSAQGVFQDRKVIIDNLPSGGHATRTLLFSPDGSKLYVSVGSSCNICLETDPRRATIMQYNPDGTGRRVYASGLRNAVGITFRPGTQELWATDNGRDYLGDNLPPETVYQILDGKDYGWPYCHAGRIVDPNFGSANSCQGIQIPVVEMQAHMAPLGLTFYNGTQFPADYQGSLFIALHGSWNSTVPVGYKVMRVPVVNGQIGQAEDFATGWLTAGGSVWGRPVDVLIAPDGSLLVSDDAGGVIYRIFYKGQ